MINTVEELIELPPDTVIRDAEGIVYEVGSTSLFWANDRSHSASQVYLPAVRLVPEKKYTTLGSIAEELQNMKDQGMTVGAVLYALERVYQVEIPMAGLV